MNCKGNELAMIKVPRGVIGEEHNGKIVFITTLYMEGHWNYEGTLTDAHGQRYVSIADWVLYPIGNPEPAYRDWETEKRICERLTIFFCIFCHTTLIDIYFHTSTTI